MARLGALAAKDIDALWAALRPRILATGRGAGTLAGVPGPQGPAGPKGVNWRGEWAADTDYEQGDLVFLDTPGGGAAELVTYYALDDHTSIASSPPAPGGTAQWWELGNAYLLLDGARPMTGDLDLDLHQVVDVRNLQLTGAIGDAVVDGVRVLHLTGDLDDGEAVVDGAERITFNDEPTKSVLERPSRIEYNAAVEAGVDYAAQAGASSWDSLEDVLVVYVASGAGVIALALGWGVLMAVNGYNPV